MNNKEAYCSCGDWKMKRIEWNVYFQGQYDINTD
jgi:hypothetical protein